MTARQGIEAIVLAGGAGARFGGGKLLAPYRQGVLIEGAVRAAMSAPADRVILVTGHDADRVAAAATRFVADAFPGRPLDVVYADRHAEGMAQTLRAGIAALSLDIAAAFVFLGDMPDIPDFVASELAARRGDRAAAAPIHQGRRGHPVLFAARLFPALLALTGDRGARHILDDLGDDLVRIEVDAPGVLFDVDHRSDLTA